MGKISPVSAKYIVHTLIDAEGIVERPDVIGAIFGQTEGLLGNELELRELQRSGRIGRIEVNLVTRSGKTSGEIVIPSSLDKAETAIIGASLETIQRIGPCNAKVRVDKIEDVRISKRSYVIERAKELLKSLTDTVLPDSQEITEEVTQSVRVMEVIEYGKDRLPAGPAVAESDEVIVVEGRADVLNLLKNGIKNVIGMNGTNVPQTIIDLCKEKTVTLFVDGDRGGDLITRELSQLAEVDYVTKAPDGKEVEEITKKEIHKALRSRVAIEQVKLDINGKRQSLERSPQIEAAKIVPVAEKPSYERRPLRSVPVRTFQSSRAPRAMSYSRPRVTKENLTKYKDMLDNLVGTRGAIILDDGSNILGKVPTSEITTTLADIRTGVDAIIFDGDINSDIVSAAERSGVKKLVAMKSKVKPSDTRINIITNADFVSN